MSLPVSSLFMLRLPLFLSGLIYFALGWFVPSLEMFKAQPGVAMQFRALALLFGFMATGLACFCHLQKPLVFWILFVTTLLYVPSAFCFLGIPMLVFLLRKDVQDYYGVELTKRRKTE